MTLCEYLGTGASPIQMLMYDIKVSMKHAVEQLHMSCLMQGSQAKSSNDALAQLGNTAHRCVATQWFTTKPICD